MLQNPPCTEWLKQQKLAKINGLAGRAPVWKFSRENPLLCPSRLLEAAHSPSSYILHFSVSFFHSHILRNFYLFNFGHAETLPLHGLFRQLRCAGFSWQWLPLLQSMGSGRWPSAAVAPGLWSSGPVLCSMWALPGPRIELVSPELADGFPSTVPLGKPFLFHF